MGNRLYAKGRIAIEIDTLFSSTRWNIIEILAEKRHSPLELSLRLKTTLANVSQQLRLLELGGLVKTQRIAQREKGKPRMLYSLADDFCYLILASPGTTGKRLVSLAPHQKFTLAIWNVAPAELHIPLAAFLGKLDESASKIDAIYLNKKFDELTIITDAKELKRHEGTLAAPKVTVRIADTSTLKTKSFEGVHFIHKRSEVYP